MAPQAGTRGAIRWSAARTALSLLRGGNAVRMTTIAVAHPPDDQVGQRLLALAVTSLQHGGGATASTTSFVPLLCVTHAGSRVLARQSP